MATDPQYPFPNGEAAASFSPTSQPLPVSLSLSLPQPLLISLFLSASPYLSLYRSLSASPSLSITLSASPHLSPSLTHSISPSFSITILSLSPFLSPSLTLLYLSPFPSLSRSCSLSPFLSLPPCLSPLLYLSPSPSLSPHFPSLPSFTSLVGRISSSPDFPPRLSLRHSDCSQHASLCSAPRVRERVQNCSSPHLATISSGSHLPRKPCCERAKGCIHSPRLRDKLPHPAELSDSLSVQLAHILGASSGFQCHFCSYNIRDVLLQRCDNGNCGHKKCNNHNK